MNTNEDVLLCTNVFDLAHYLAYRIGITSLETQRANDGRIVYTPEANGRVTQFIALCTDEYNRTHGTTFNSRDIAELVQELTDRDVLNYQRLSNIPR
jgi:hypothetical protein